MQKFIFGENNIWKAGASLILKQVRGLGLAENFFWTKYVDRDLKDLPLYYHSVLKAWMSIRTVRKTPTMPLFWLLNEPVVGGARLDIDEKVIPGITDSLTNAKVITMGHLLDIWGCNFDRIEATAQYLGMTFILGRLAMENITWNHCSECIYYK